MNTTITSLRCIHCDAEFPVSRMDTGCPRCSSPGFAAGLTPHYDYDRIRTVLCDGSLAAAGGGIWRYRALLPARREHEVSLGEGRTPLIELPRVAAALDAEQVWVKDESRNPTWTFKDRNAAVTVSMARQFGAETVVVSTSGNHGASVAAYAARAGMCCVVLTYPGISPTTRALIESFGAQLVITEPSDRWKAMERGIREEGWYPGSNFTAIPTNTAYGHEGYKTIAYEIVEALGAVPDVVSVPNAYGEGLFGIWKGFDELELLGRTSARPRMLAVEPVGGPLAMAMRMPRGRIATVPRTPTIARGIGGATNSYASVAALERSRGTVVQSGDDEILAAQRCLYSEGVAVEPASAAALAGLRRLHREGQLAPGQRIVVINTSSGLKNLSALADPRTVQAKA